MSSRILTMRCTIWRSEAFVQHKDHKYSCWYAVCCLRLPWEIWQRQSKEWLCLADSSNYSSPLWWSLSLQVSKILYLQKISKWTPRLDKRTDSASSSSTKQTTWWPEYAVRQGTKRKTISNSDQAIQSENIDQVAKLGCCNSCEAFLGLSVMLSEGKWLNTEYMDLWETFLEYTFCIAGNNNEKIDREMSELFNI